MDMRVFENDRDVLVLKNSLFYSLFVSALMLFMSVFILLLLMTTPIREHSWWSICAIAGLMAGIVFFYQFFRHSKWVFDRPADKLILSELTIFGRRRYEHRISDIKDAFVEPGNDDTSRVSLRFLNEIVQPLPLHRVYTGGTQSQEELARVINAWLHKHTG